MIGLLSVLLRKLSVKPPVDRVGWLMVLRLLDRSERLDVCCA